MVFFNRSKFKHIKWKKTAAIVMTSLFLVVTVNICASAAGGGFVGKNFRKMEGTLMFLCSGAGICPGIFACNLLQPSASDVLLIVRDAPFEKSMIRGFLRSENASGSVIFRDFDSPEEVEKVCRTIRIKKT